MCLLQCHVIVANLKSCILAGWHFTALSTSQNHRTSFQLHSIIRTSSPHHPSVSSLSPAIHKERDSTQIKMPPPPKIRPWLHSVLRRHPSPAKSELHNDLCRCLSLKAELRTHFHIHHPSLLNAECQTWICSIRWPSWEYSGDLVISCLLALPSRNYFVGLDFILFVSVT